MDNQSSPVCILNTVNDIPNVVISHGIQNKQILQSSSNQLLYLVDIAQLNETHLVQSTEQKNGAGFCVYKATQNNSNETVKSAKFYVPKQKINTQVHAPTCKNPIQIRRDDGSTKNDDPVHGDCNNPVSTLSIETIKDEGSQVDWIKEVDTSKNVVYRVMFPDELQLKPLQTRRGRPKKRLKEEKIENALPKVDEEPKVVQNMRTRSGRITRPPRHIRKDFSKIETSETDNNETDIKVVEFEPLKTNQARSSELLTTDTQKPAHPKRKRPMSSQYRCPKCHKAYLGHNRIVMHLQKHPDHGPIPDRSKREENETWNYLINISNSNPVGKRGLKLCKQLLVLIKNIQVVAKFMFKKPTGVEKNLFFVDSLLSKIFDIDTGNYVINESNFHKDLNILQFIAEEISNNRNVEVEQTTSFDLHAYVEQNPLDNQVRNDVEHLQLNQSSPVIESSNTNFNCTNIKDNIKLNSALSFDPIQTSGSILKIANNKSQNLNFPQDLQFQQASNFSDEHQNKLLDSAMNIIEACASAQTNLRNSNEYSLQNVLLSENSLLNSLPTLRTSVEDLILSNVDSTQVTNLLDNSTSSDEVMNVDQFVNERFKNFTEPDIELPNSSLSLELPPLDLFQFHSS